MPSLKRPHWPSILLAYLSLMSLGFLDNTRGPFFPDLILALELSDFNSSLFFVATSVAAVISGFWGAPVLRAWGSLMTLRAGLAAMGLAFVGMSQMTSFMGLLAFAALFGLGFGWVSVAQNVVIWESSPDHRRRQLMSGLHSMYAFAALVAPAMASVLAWMQWTWREGFLVAGLWPLLVLIGSIRLRPLTAARTSSPTPAPTSTSSSTSSSASTTASTTASTSTRAAQNPTPTPQRVTWQALYVSVVISFYMFAEISLGTRLVQYLRRELDYSEVVAPLYLALFFLGLWLGRLSFMLLNTGRWSNQRVMLASAVTSMLAYVLGLIFQQPWLLVSCGLLLGPFYPVALNYVTERFPNSTSQALAFCAGSGSLLVVILHFSLGILTEHFGLHLALFVGPLGLLVPTVFLLMARNPSPDRKEQRASS